IEVGRRLARHGVTGAVDATPGPGRVDAIRAAQSEGVLPQRITVLADVDEPGGRIELGPLKLMLDERDLPSPSELADRFSAARGRGRAVAVHCTTRAELAVLLAACARSRPPAGSRIEHGAIIPEDAIGSIRDAGFAVVTQPGFLVARGDRYAAEVDPEDLPSLYRVGSLLAAGIPVAFASDAPYGPDSPWEILHAATARRSVAGRTLGADERVSAHTALDAFLSPAGEPGGPARRVDIGGCADLAVLAPDTVIGTPENPVVATVIDGRVVYRRRLPEES
ncbi:MAG: amidohydrolase family protein, partial [Microbacterium sp.]